MVLETMKAADYLERDGISTEIVDLRSLKPLDSETLIDSVEKTGHLTVVDGATRTTGFAAEVITIVTEKVFSHLKASPQRITLPDLPTPSSPALANIYYPRTINIINTVRSMFDLPKRTEEDLGIKHEQPLDVPDKTFIGPF
jgi:pyruvate dehydrogenase E1 component beta subunit